MDRQKLNIVVMKALTWCIKFYLKIVYQAFSLVCVAFYINTYQETNVATKMEVRRTT